MLAGEQAAEGERVAQAYDAWAPTYDVEHQHAFEHAEDRVVKRWISRCLKPSDRLLDVGCGTGLLIDLLPELRPWCYTGIDCSRGMLDQARLKHPTHRLVQADLCTWQPPSPEWDRVVALFGTLSHVRDQPLVAQRLRAWTAPNGRVQAMWHGASRARRRPLPPMPWQPMTRTALRAIWQPLFADVQLRPLWVHADGLRWLPLPLLVRYLEAEQRLLPYADGMYWCLDARV